MARPLNKKYFGNRNIGVGGLQTGGNNSNSENYADDRIGGEGVASYGSVVAGSGWTTTPTVAFSAPNIPGGVNVAGTVRYKALSFATTANGIGYNVGDVLEVDTGTQTTKARAPVASIVVTNVEIVNDGISYDDGNTITFDGAGWTTPLIVNVVDADGPGNLVTVSIQQAGIRNEAAPTNPISGGTTGTGTGGDANGTGATFNLTWGVYAFGTVSVAGSYTTFPSTGGAGTLTSVSPATGTGAKADITMGLLSVTVTQRGSGYTSPADAAITFSGSTGAAVTAVLTTSTGAPGSATNQENAIVIRAKVDSEASVAIGDIIRQVNTRGYKVKTLNGIAVCKLVASDAPGARQAYIVATAANGSTYYVTKLTAHKATLVYKSGTSLPALAGKSAPWSFAPASGTTVQIENA